MKISIILIIILLIKNSLKSDFFLLHRFLIHVRFDRRVEEYRQQSFWPPIVAQWNLLMKYQPISTKLLQHWRNPIIIDGRIVFLKKLTKQKSIFFFFYLKEKQQMKTIPLVVRKCETTRRLRSIDVRLDFSTPNSNHQFVQNLALHETTVGIDAWHRRLDCLDKKSSYIVLNTHEQTQCVMRDLK